MCAFKSYNELFLMFAISVLLERLFNMSKYAILWCMPTRIHVCQCWQWMPVTIFGRL